MDPDPVFGGDEPAALYASARAPEPSSFDLRHHVDRRGEPPPCRQTKEACPRVSSTATGIMSTRVRTAVRDSEQKIIELDVALVAARGNALARESRRRPPQARRPSGAVRLRLAQRPVVRVWGTEHLPESTPHLDRMERNT